MAEIPREMLVKYTLTNTDLGESEISEVIKKYIFLSGILIIRYYNQITNAFHFHQKWKLDLNKYSYSIKNRSSNNLNISSIYEIREKGFS